MACLAQFVCKDIRTHGISLKNFFYSTLKFILTFGFVLGFLKLFQSRKKAEEECTFTLYFKKHLTKDV